eukprot:TRINITY_DN58202_c0_g1_i1.p1 TRINITY_DN58202_c0_g1~~TRINITY_DN58202_c0_g1_i1.p1  ORF type:complete len:273 (-),score=50.56 TRINITY_DN58202_c0_g1_i1:81-899(-)
MKKCFRKRNRDQNSDDEAEDSESKDISEKLEDTRKRQKHRTWKVSFTGAMRTTEKDDEDDNPQWGLQHLNSTLQEYTGSNEGHNTALNHEDKMHAFVEEQIRKRRGGEEDADGTEQAAQPKSIEAQAVATPAHLTKSEMISTEDANRWLTGIQEVALPVEYKIRNIEDAEVAKKKHVAKAKQGTAPRTHTTNKLVASQYNDAHTHHKRFLVTSANAGGIHSKEVTEMFRQEEEVNKELEETDDQFRSITEQIVELRKQTTPRINPGQTPLGM